MENLSRRHFLKVSAASASGLALLPYCTTDSEKSQWQFFSNSEASLAIAMAEQIIPADDAPGATDVGVIYFLDNKLAGFYKKYQTEYRAGLKGVNRSSEATYDQDFTELSFEQQTALLKKIEAAEVDSQLWQGVSPSRFFRLFRTHCMQGFYGHPKHGGNKGFASYKMLDITPF